MIDIYTFKEESNLRVQCLHTEGGKTQGYLILNGVCSCRGGLYGKCCKHLRMLGRTFFVDEIAEFEFKMVVAELEKHGIVVPLLETGPRAYRSVAVERRGTPGLFVWLVDVRKKTFVVYVTQKEN